jgi:cyanophycinase
MVLSGTSAGCVIHNGPGMINGGVSYEGLKHGPFSTEQNDTDLLLYVTEGGFNTFPYGFLDSHHGDRGRQGRFIRLITFLNGKYGFGVDEDTAMVIQSDQFTVQGTQGVTIYDFENAVVGHNDHFKLENALIHYLTTGDSYNFTSKKVTFADWKSTLVGREQHETARTSNDIFSSYRNVDEQDYRKNPMEFVKVSTEMYNSKSTQTTGWSYEIEPTFEVVMQKEGVGYEGTQNNKSYISFSGMKASIYAQ